MRWSCDFLILIICILIPKKKVFIWDEVQSISKPGIGQVCPEYSNPHTERFGNFEQINAKANFVEINIKISCSLEMCSQMWPMIVPSLESRAPGDCLVRLLVRLVPCFSSRKPGNPLSPLRTLTAWGYCSAPEKEKNESLVPAGGRSRFIFKNAMFNLVLLIGIFRSPHDNVLMWIPPGVWFNIKISSYQYRKSHCGDKTVLRSSYLHTGISYTGKMTSLYWINWPWTLLMIKVNTTWVMAWHCQATSHYLSHMATLGHNDIHTSLGVLWDFATPH